MTTETKRTLRDVQQLLERAVTIDRSINIGGSVIHSMVGQTLTNCTNAIENSAPGERKELLEALNRDVQKLLASLPADKKDDAPQIVENFEALVKQATSEKPNRKWYSFSAEGLLEASSWVADFTDKIGETILNLGKAIWPGYQLPTSA